MDSVSLSYTQLVAKTTILIRQGNWAEAAKNIQRIRDIFGQTAQADKFEVSMRRAKFVYDRVSDATKPPINQADLSNRWKAAVNHFTPKNAQAWLSNQPVEVQNAINAIPPK
jgi:hypothetical protein